MRPQVLFLSDVLVPGKDFNKRFNTDYVQYRAFRPLEIALAFVPHAPLLGPVLIGTLLQKAGYRVTVLECAFRPMQRKNLWAALSREPKYIFISTTFIEDLSLLESLVNEIRERVPLAKIIFGGPSLWTGMDMRALADYGVVGEGEEAIIPLLAALEAGEEPTGLPGVYSTKIGVADLIPPRLMSNLDVGPFPDWSLVNRNKDEFYPMFTQRGCHWRCAFCSYPANEGYKLRFVSIPRLMEQILHNYEKFGIWRYVFSDSTFTYPHDRCLEFLEEIARLPFAIEWIAYGRVDNITPELASAMRRSGCKGIFFGCDSGDAEMLVKMNKRFTVDEMRRGVALTQAEKIPCTASWIVGFPGETAASVRNTLALILELRCSQNVVHTFQIQEQAPVGLRREKFSVKGESVNWIHATMNSQRAMRWTRWVVLQMISSGLNLGAVFDSSWMSTVGLGPDDTNDFFRLAQKVGRAQLNFKPERLKRAGISTTDGCEEELLKMCERIRSRASDHPLFQVNFEP